MSKPDLMALAEEERTELLALLRTLTDTQWNAPSLCSQWRVRDVATHVVSYDELSKATLAATFLRGALRVSRVNDVALKRYDALEPDDIIDLVSRNTRGLTSGFRGGIALTDGTIHHQDIRRALGLARTIPTSRLPAVLDFALQAPTLPAKKHAKNLSLVATDIDWSTGEGPEIIGTAEALLMCVAGRTQALDELSGPGLGTLRSRVVRTRAS
ncbi:maleylpyruvate isomerase family mycothiol-dependent enzyme [Nocardioides halotolerans]|uniref:maleylpyruvate isomerase family mycothiol-dependent enzyme n=1 Tax=Nocardioides halotolerans TaxID=433660 RepID=UPI00042A6223|nr:maleylpyruvate isomerase family mycothiol-dependent enzyme [Nocardioides halotolerans]